MKTEILKDISSLTLEEKINDPGIPEWHKEILGKRLKKVEDGEMEFVSWEKMKALLQERMKK